MGSCATTNRPINARLIRPVRRTDNYLTLSFSLTTGKLDAFLGPYDKPKLKLALTARFPQLHATIPESTTEISYLCGLHGLFAELDKNRRERQQADRDGQRGDERRGRRT